MTNMPKRRIQLRLDLQADSWSELASALESIQHRCLEQCDRSPDDSLIVTSGGCGSGHHLHVTVDTTKTAATYQAELGEWVERQNVRGDLL